ncbi:MAG TPA: hypothetical protein VEC94_08920 [Pseudolabrys sp.]|jgi:hypothetical protein|nr:hypothetical protein [Pseudolabrys sp.]
METFSTLLRSVRRETDERRDHLDIFREFLDHLRRISRGRNELTAASKDMRTQR